ncbi:MAG: multiubiquitin domain-containing protein [Martelella sp.]|uniref:multiubiquitin domain-containing protein n=1 Tax=Martelella sp. TaxID=1969699 RepID=UPI003242439F
MEHWDIRIGDQNLEFRDFGTNDPLITFDQVLGYVNATPRDEYDVYIFGSDGELKRMDPEKSQDLRQPGAEHFLVFRTDRAYRMKIDDDRIDWGVRWISGKALRTISGIPPEAELYLERKDEADRKIEDCDMLDLDKHSVERFYSRKPHWKLKIRQNVYTFDRAIVSVREALTEAGFDLQKGWDMVLITASGRQNKTIDDTLDLSEPGIEKLRVKPKAVNNGEARPSSVRAFDLLEKDVRFLDNLNIRWETIEDAGKRWLIIRGYEVPPGFDVQRIDLALMIPKNYPATQIDMFYCNPPAKRADGRPCDKTQKNEVIEGHSYQRWSRHRDGVSAWNPDIDCIETHLELVEECFGREVGR